MPLDRPTLASATDHRRSRRRRIRNLSIAAVIVVVGAGVGVAFADSSSSSRYRTATVTSKATEQALHGVGTIEPVAQATVAFPTAGTVATVAVKPGDTVTAGTELASLDQASLDEAVRAAQANLDQATLALERARNGQSTGLSSGTGAQPIADVTGTGSGTNAVLLAAMVTDNELAAAQQAVIDAQKQVDDDLIAADQAYATAQQVCASITTTTSSDSSDSSDDSSSSSSDPSDDVTACSNALNDVLDAQHKVSQSQDALVSASSAYDKLLAERAADLAAKGGGTNTAPSGTNGGSAPSGSAPSGSAPTGSSSGRTSTSPSAADLAAYQKAVDAAEANLAVAQQAVLQAIIVSPIAGTVVAVNMAPGDSVTAGSTTATIVIAGTGGYEAVTMVKVTDLPKLKVGQSAVVQPDGTTSTITGKVANIGLVSTSSSTGTTYPVTIGFSGDTGELHNGGTASVAITTASADAGLAVPSSAVHANNGTYTVTTLEGDTTKDVTVEIGAIGPEWTEIKSGLNAGQTVVLADLEQPLPSSATSSTNGQQQNPFAGRGRFVTPAN